MNRVGIEMPKIEVRYEHLSVEGEVRVGARAHPTLPNVFLNIAEVTFSNFPPKFNSHFRIRTVN